MQRSTAPSDGGLGAAATPMGDAAVDMMLEPHAAMMMDPRAAAAAQHQQLPELVVALQSRVRELEAQLAARPRKSR